MSHLILGPRLRLAIVFADCFEAYGTSGYLRMELLGIYDLKLLNVTGELFRGMYIRFLNNYIEYVRESLMN